MKLGEIIAKFREQLGITQEQLAKSIGISRAALSHYEKNRREPDYDTLIKMSNFFEVPVDYLLKEVNIDFEKTRKEIDESKLYEYKIFIDDKEVSKEEISLAIQYIKFLRKNK